MFAAGLLNWSLISFVNLVTSLLLRFNAPKRGNVLVLDLNKANLQGHLVEIVACINSILFVSARIKCHMTQHMIVSSPYCCKIIFFFVPCISFAAGFRFRGRVLSLWFILIYSAFVIILQAIFITLSGTRDSQWTIADAWWIKLLGLME